MSSDFLELLMLVCVIWLVFSLIHIGININESKRIAIIGWSLSAIAAIIMGIFIIKSI